VIAGFVWATYAAMLGYVGGSTFEEQPFKGFALAFAAALLITGAIEGYRWLRRRRAIVDG
jgi:membrane protein DedA with SNARE-associated domain